MTDPFLRELAQVLALPALHLVPYSAQPQAGFKLYPIPETVWQVQLPDTCGPRVVFQICALLKQHVTARARISELEDQLAQLTRELDALLNVSQVSEDETQLGEGILPDLGDIRWAVLKHGTLLLNKGLGDHTIVPSMRRLQREEEFSYVVSGGEHWGLRVDRFAVICESDQRIGPLMRQLIRLRLEWLNRSVRERQMAERMQHILSTHREDLERLRKDEESSRWSAVELRKRLDQLHNEFECTLRQATTDTLTRAYNRAKIDEILGSLCGRSTVPPFCLLVIDVDRFKHINDVHGHLVGDQTLIAVVSAMRNVLRQTDVLARWGGDEFVVVLTDSELSLAFTCAQRLRRSVSTLYVTPDSEPGLISLSIGIAQHLPGEPPHELFRRADEALMQAKRDGRDRVVTG